MIKALIVENEPESAGLLASILREFINDVDLVGICHDVDSAVKKLHINSPDIVFLDIELDGESGFDLFQKVKVRTFETVFTTAYPDYAVRAIKHACLEYLIKPVRKEDLIDAIRKYHDKKNIIDYRAQIEALIHNLKKPTEQKLCIPVTGGFVYLNKSEVVMCKAEANYTIIFSAGGEKLLCSKNIGSLEEMLADDTMFRCHKSFLINTIHVKRIQNKDDCRAFLTGGLSAEISLRKKEELRERLKRPR